MNLTSVAAAVALAVWEIRASKQQIGLTVTSAKQVRNKARLATQGGGGKSDLQIAGDCVGSGPGLVSGLPGVHQLVSFDLVIKMRRPADQRRLPPRPTSHFPLPAEAPSTVGRRQTQCKSFTSQ